MRGWLHLRLFSLALLQFCLLPYFLCAQLPRRLERCLPYPTLAQEISAMNEEAQSPGPEQPPLPKIIIVTIAFAPGTHIPPALRDRIIGSIRSPQLYDDPEQSWIEELQDVGVLGVLQDSGYYKATAKVEARVVEANQQRMRYALTLHIEEGWQYRLGDIRFEGTTHDESLAFPGNELRDLIPLKRGDIFSARKIRMGLKALTKLYDTNGYIDMVPTPIIDDDGDGDPLDLVMHIEEGKQYRFGKIAFLGLDAKTQARLRPQLKSGDIFNLDLIDQLLKQNKTLLPADASSNDMSIERDQGEGLVDISFDFYACPKAGNKTTSFAPQVQ